MKISHIIGRTWLIGCIALGLSTHAQTVSWIGPTNGSDWSVPANWSSGIVPGLGTNVIIGPSNTVSYILPAAGIGVLTNKGILAVNANGFTNTGIVMLNPGGTGKLFVSSIVNVIGNLGFCSNSFVAVTSGGSLRVSGTIWIGCGQTNGPTGATAGSYGVLSLNSGGTLNAAATAINPGNGSLPSGGQSALLVIFGGTNNLGNVSIKRSSGTGGFNPIGSEGLVVNDGIVTMTNLNVGGPGGNSYLSAVIAGGTVTNFGNVYINQLTAGRGSRLLQTNGLFVVPDPGIINPNPTVAGSLNIFSVTGGTNLTGGLYFGNGGSGGLVQFTNSAVIYIGSQGIASNGVVLLTTALNNGGMFGATADWTGSAAMNLTGGSFAFSPVDPAGIPHTITLTGLLSGGGGLVVTNGGTLVLAAPNTYSGGTTVSAGSLVLGNSSGLPGGSSLTVGGSGTAGIVDLAGFSPQLSRLATLGTAASQVITNSSATTVSTLTFSNSTVASTFGGVIAAGSKPVDLTVLAGNLTLSGQNNYAGNIYINNGTLALSGPGSSFTGAGAAIVLGNSASVLDLTGMNTLSLAAGQSLSGYGVVTGTVSAANCRLSPGLNGAGGPLTIAGNLALNGGVTNQFNLQFNPNAPGNSRLIVAGSLNLSGLNTVQINPVDGTLSAGTYHLILCNSVGSGGAINFVLATQPGLQASIQVTATGVDLVVALSSQQLIWRGDGAANLWDLVSTNWLDAGLPVAFTNGNFVVFDGTSTNKSINLAGALQPAFVTVNASADYTFAGAGKITGTVTLSKTNSGKLLILTTNDYQGVTTIGQGTIQVGNGTAFGSLGTGLVADDGRLLMAQPGNYTLSNTISGSGSLVQSGSGTLTLAGSNIFSGGTTINAGALQIGNGGTVGTGNVTDDTALIFASSASSLVNSAISGGGSLAIIGPGPVTLTGSNTYGGGTIVSNSTLIVNNSSGSSTGSGAVIVSTGGTLAGTGTTAGSVVIANGGSFAPGNGGGTLTVGGNFTASPGAVLNYALGTNSSTAVAAGNLTLNGTLNITNSGGLGNGTYRLFTYGGSLSGTTVLGVTPSLGKTYVINTNTPGQVNLIVTNILGIGTGPAVTLTDNGTTVTLSNGIVSIVITKSDAHIGSMIYRGLDVVAGGSDGGKFYWSWNAPSFENPANCIYTLLQDPATNGGTVAEIALLSQWSGSAGKAAMDVDIHYFLVQGAQGFYASAIVRHPAGYPDNPGGEFRMVGYLNPTFNWLSVDNLRSRLMPLASTASVAVPGAPKEFQLWTAGIQQGQYDCKYSYSADIGDENAWGWSSTATNMGVWMTIPSREYYNGGPTKRELMCHDDQGGIGPVLLQMINGTHYTGGSDTDIAAGETFSKTFGPWLVYANSVPPGISNAPAALFADAQAQALAEQAFWPYAWWNNPAYPLKSSRGTVTGVIKIADGGNPNASPAGLWVGVAQAPPSSIGNADFQYWEKNLQFWTKTDASGNFSIPNVVAGTNYTLFAFGPGATGTFQSQPLAGSSLTTLSIPASPFSVTVAPGLTNLGTVTWTPSRIGSTVWEIGLPDRTPGEFFHGTDWWYADIGPSPAQPSPNWMKSFDFATDFPAGLAYTVGQSQWSTGWNFAHAALGTNASAAETWKVFFNLPQAPTNSAPASLYIGSAADFSGPVQVVLNGSTITSGITPPSGHDDTLIRLGIHGVFSDLRLNFAGNLLHAGQNELDLTMTHTGNVEYSIMYDYLRLELAGYVPPAPVNLAAAVNYTQVALNWTAMSGATSYAVKRAGNVNGVYTVIATNIFAPVVGSGITNGAYLDTAAPVGTNYYVVASVNPNGSTNSSPVIAVVKAPPQISQSQVLNGTFTWGGSGGTPGQAYYILASTNLSLPLAQWTRVLTNTFDASGNFSATNALPANRPQNYYLLQIPPP